MKPEWWGAPWVQENNYKEKQPDIRSDDDDDDDDDEMTIQEIDGNISSRDRFPEELNWIKVNLKQLHN